MPSLFSTSWPWRRRQDDNRVTRILHTDTARITLDNALGLSSVDGLGFTPRASDNNSEFDDYSDRDSRWSSYTGHTDPESDGLHVTEADNDDSAFDLEDDGAVFALSSDTYSEQSNISEVPSFPSGAHLQLRIFVGTWNMAAHDPFATAKGQYIGDHAAAEELTEFLPLGYDLYVVGTQEKVSKHLHTAVLARLNSSGSAGYSRVDLSKPENQCTGADARESSVLRASSFGLESSALSTRSAHSPHSEDPAAGRWSTAVLSPSSGKRNKLRDSVLVGQNGEVRGRGDGAFLTRKSTSLGVFAAPHVASRVRVVAAGAHKFSVASGSKGGLAVALQFGGDPQVLTFANCHLEANHPAVRRRQLATLARELPAAMGLSGDDLAASSDHVVWVGDFNYRLRSVDADDVVAMLRSGRHLELHDRYDTLADDLALVPALSSFREPRKTPSFFPTYKKVPGRLPADRDDANWPRRVYRLTYREPFYKGGRRRARVPAWCDRVLVSSSGSFKGQLEVEQCRVGLGTVSSNLGTSADSGTPRTGDNYRAINDSLLDSDHSPVACAFVWRVQHPFTV